MCTVMSTELMSRLSAELETCVGGEGGGEGGGSNKHEMLNGENSESII